MNKPITSAGDFLRGQRDCMEGRPHEDGQSDDYNRGYATQYQHEQNMDALSDWQQARSRATVGGRWK